MLKINRSAAAALILIVGAVGILAFTLARPAPAPPPPPSSAPPVRTGGDPAALARVPHLLFRRATGSGVPTNIELAALSDLAAARGTTSLECARISFAVDRGICLETTRGVMTTYHAVVFDRGFQPLHTLTLDGAPTRTRISADGRYGAITVFVTGAEHGYNSVTFSTKSLLVDMAAGTVLANLEQFTTTRDGQPFTAKDFNFWGVTFSPDSNTFFATLMTDRKTYLVRGDIARRTFAVLRENVECPALSPDGRLIAYKKRVGGDTDPWRFHVMDLATLSERPIAAETRSIDDQLEWLDNQHVLYATARSSQSSISDIWVAPVTGTEPARPLVAEADNPVVVR